MPVAHGVYPVQYHAMAQEAQPVQYQLTHGVQSRYVSSTPVVPAPQVDRSGVTPRLVSQNVVNATRGVSDNVAAPFGQRALPPGQQKSRLQSLPKALEYGGRGRWQAFLTKFEKFSSIFEWEDRAKRDYLCLCLTDKASEYYALVMEREVDLSYLEVVDKLERRFGYRDLPETARVTFSSARQGEHESVDDWADRVLPLACEAYRDLPEASMLQESIVRFCMGAREKEAGELVINQRPASIEQAIDLLK